MLRMPRESGIYSIWVASLAFAAPFMHSYGPRPLVLDALAGSLAMLPATGYARMRSIGFRLAALLSVAAPYAVAVAYTWPQGILAAATGAFLLYSSLRFQALTVVLGGGLVAFHGTMLALASHAPLILAFLPVPYAILGSAEALIRISGESIQALIAEASCMILVLGFAVLYADAWSLAGAIVIIDVALRILVRIMGLASRIPLKAYGVIEFIRLTLVLSMVGLYYA